MFIKFKPNEHKRDMYIAFLYDKVKEINGYFFPINFNLSDEVSASDNYGGAPEIEIFTKTQYNSYLPVIGNEDWKFKKSPIAFDFNSNAETKNILWICENQFDSTCIECPIVDTDFFDINKK